MSLRNSVFVDGALCYILIVIAVICKIENSIAKKWVGGNSIFCCYKRHFERPFKTDGCTLTSKNKKAHGIHL